MTQYRALIVDDEYTTRALLREMINWEKANFAPPVLASNGEEALQLLARELFDIVFTDVEMPVMDGIELIEKARVIKPNQRFVIISCHEKFEYAQRALRLGVQDYIIKDLMTENELNSLLCSVAPEEMAVGEADHTLSLDRLLKSAAQGATLKKERLPGENAAVYAIVVDGLEKLRFEQGAEEAVMRMSSFAKQISCLAVWNTEDDLIYALCQAPDTVSTLFFINDATARANAIRSVARGFHLGSVSIGISNPVSSMDKLKDACMEAAEAVKMRVVEGLNKTIFYNCISMKKQLVDQQHIDMLLERVEELAYNGNMNCLRYVDKLYGMKMPSGFADANYFRYLNVRFWSMLAALAKWKSFTKFEITAEMGLKLEEINAMEDSAMMAQFFKSVLMKLLIVTEPENRTGIVTAALTIIEEEYTSDLSLNRLADRLHTNKSYLCRIFKEQVGENVMTYIENKRIERAKYLLRNSQMRLWEISDALGYASQQYFSYVFKKYTGQSPTDFRKQGEIAK